MNFFSDTPTAPADPILSLATLFRNDPRLTKVNLGIGAYRTVELKPLVLSVVKEAEERLLQKGLYKEYLPIEGEKNFLNGAKKLIFQDKSLFVAQIQTLGGTGALSIGARFLKERNFQKVALSQPTWDNHQRIFAQAGFEVTHYFYYDDQLHAFSFEQMMRSLEQLPEKSVIVLHSSCHNPTGSDPTDKEWEVILAFLQKRNIFPFFDIAYQGFGRGMVEDAFPITLAYKMGMEMAIAQSFSKNFGLYSERIGSLMITCQNSAEKEAIESQLKILIRGIYSNPSCHGSRIITEILEDPILEEKWLREVIVMRERISEMRGQFVAYLEAKSPEGKTPFGHMAHARGMFAYTGLRKDQVAQLINNYGIYMPASGRINLAGLNSENLPYVADAILNVYET